MAEGELDKEKLLVLEEAEAIINSYVRETVRDSINRHALLTKVLVGVTLACLIIWARKGISKNI